MNLQETFELYKKPAPMTIDICEHLDTLKDLSAECEHVTEMGFRTGTSFIALLMGNPKKLISYDLKIPSYAKDKLDQLKGSTEIELIEANTLHLDIEPTDLLFIDTFHTYSQLKRELEIHGNKARKYLAFHDVESFKDKGEDGAEPGLAMAIIEFVEANPHWSLHMHLRNNNGLLILKRSN